MKRPIISVVMPVYNGEKYLREAIDSILTQTYTDFEFIILNDGSIDSTEEIILSYDDSRIVYVKNEKNLQIVKTLNKGIDLAKGEYIARMDADDISLPERFEKQMEFMEKNPDIDVCGTWYKTFGKNEYLHKLPVEHEQIKADLLFYCPLAHPTIMMKRSIFDTYEYPDNFPKAEDYALWTKLVEYYKFSNIPICLLHYRLHSDQTGEIYNSIQFNSSKMALNIFFSNVKIGTVQEIHCQMWQHKVVPLQDVEDWLISLKKINSKKKIFDEISLYNTLFNQWWIMNNLQPTFDLLSMFHFYKSSLYMPKKLSLILHLKFIIKSLIFYKRAIA